MYKGASRGTGASRSNGYARVASDRSIEYHSSGTEFSLKLMKIIQGPVDLETLPDYDLAEICGKLVRGGYTPNKWLGSVAGELGNRLAASGERCRMTRYERRVAETVIWELLERWRSYRL